MDILETVLIVEDDVRLGALLEDYLKSNGLSVSRETNGLEAISRIGGVTPPSVVVLDLMLPGCSGLDVLRAVRPRYTGGVLILTANKSEFDQVVGLELGADDYVTRPVEPRVLLARLRSLLRRLEPRAPTERPREDRLTLGTLCIDRARREVSVSGARVELTGVEFSLLWTLATHAGEVVSRDELYTDVLGTRYDGIDRGVDIHISRLRRKLTEGGLDATAVKSVRGAGYLLVR